MDNHHLIEAIQNLFDNTDFNSHHHFDTDGLNEVFKYLASQGVDLSQYSFDEIRSALDHALTIDATDAGDHFLNFIAYKGILISNLQPLVAEIKGYGNDSSGFYDADKAHYLTQSMQKIHADYYNQATVKSYVSSVEHKIGSNIGHHFNHSGVTFRGITKLLEMVNYNGKVLTEKVAEFAIKESPTISNNDSELQSLFNKFLKLLKIL